MGYTHYFGIKEGLITEENEKKLEKLYQKAIKDCHKIILSYQKEHKGTKESLSGYSAHTKLGQYGGLKINGKERLSHDDFCVRETLKQNESFDFCKTARKPYDKVVTACLSALKFHLGECFEVSSDGEHEDWTEGVELANKVLKRKKNLIKSPIKAPPTLQVVLGVA